MLHCKTVEYTLHLLVAEAVGESVQFGVAEFAAGHHIELRARRFLHRIYLVALACSGEGTALVEMCREYDFGVNLVVGAARA